MLFIRKLQATQPEWLIYNLMNAFLALLIESYIND